MPAPQPPKLSLDPPITHPDCCVTYFLHCESFQCRAHLAYRSLDLSACYSIFGSPCSHSIVDDVFRTNAELGQPKPHHIFTVCAHAGATVHRRSQQVARNQSKQNQVKAKLLAEESCTSRITVMPQLVIGRTLSSARRS